MAFCSATRIREAVCVHLAQHAENALDDQRRKAERGFIENQQTRLRDERAADRQHLLLAAGEHAGALMAALLQDREILIHPIKSRVEGAARAPAISAELQIIFDREIRKQHAPLGHLDDAEVDDVFRRTPLDRPSLEKYLA